MPRVTPQSTQSPGRESSLVLVFSNPLSPQELNSCKNGKKTQKRAKLQNSFNSYRTVKRTLEQINNHKVRQEQLYKTIPEENEKVS